MVTQLINRFCRKVQP